jgi:hypothetical protein
VSACALRFPCHLTFGWFCPPCREARNRCTGTGSNSYPTDNPAPGLPWRLLDLISSRLLGAEPGSLRNLKGIGTPNYRRATHESDGRPLPANEVPR